ncbi:hypothetical protein DUNSADRAFT_1759 [Dunaliella salina]|uniref:Auto-transporter adhesin head GIN domain-containing protein n=1 Tax=Dunaliella salina TaxID=3046 RepID=A0ABQ7FX44_DUNSA|nr:hypothetical protein DUNSADRAFT_1759 [Dunaliella salina]|eukprot:KAF5826916.1 hypothetical protein DUNSADRAFT_1759 [Dunaliella salina]
MPLSEAFLETLPQVEVIDGVVVLSVNGSFEANSTIKATVFPANATALRAVQNFGIGKIVAKDLSSEEFSTSASGTGGVYVYNLTASRVRVISASTATVLLNGTIEGAVVQTSATARAFLLGVSGTSNVALEGISTTYIEGSPDLKIRGTADSLSRLLYTDGDCDIQPSLPLASRTSLFGRNFFGNPCRKVEPLDLSLQHTFSCGLLSNGTSSCSGPRQRANALGISLNATRPPFAPDSATPGAAAAGAAQADQPATSPTITTIVRRPGGQVATGTYTSGPGASAQAGSRVSGTGFPPFGQFQRQAGDAPAEVGSVSDVGSPSQTSPPGPSASVRNTQIRLSIPEGGSGLAVVNVECDDRLVPMLE